MDNKIYVWLFNNINKYEFEGDEANQIRTAISRMLVTEDSINSDAIIDKMQNLYLSFCKLFYNNILGYQNGLVNNQITASELDCYLIQTSDGMVPIGYYRNIRPAEAASMMQRYLDQCKKDISTEKNQIIVKWQTSIDSISTKYETIKNSKNPSVARVIIGAILVLAIYAFSVVSLIKMDFIGVLLKWGDLEVLKMALTNVPFISHGTQSAWIGYLVFIIFAISIAILGTIFTIKEIKLISAKITTKSILNNILSYVNRLEQGVSSTIENSSAIFYDAARKGENNKTAKNTNSILALTVDKQIKTAKDFTEKTEGQRRGINYIVIALLLSMVILFSLSYSQGIADSIEIMKINNAQNINNQKVSTGSADTNNTPTPTATEKPKVSSYAAYTSDATWIEANQYAYNHGGYLVCINDEEEFYKVCQKADEENIKVFWVGAKRNSYDDWEDTKWLDGEEITYTNWLSGEPTYYDEEGNDEVYLMVFKVKGVWYFNDATNDVSQYYRGKMGYIVEIEE